MPLFLFLFPLQHMKRPALHNKQVGVLRMAFRARKVFRTFEIRAPDSGELGELPTRNHNLEYIANMELWHSRNRIFEEDGGLSANLCLLYTSPSPRDA